MIFKPFDLPKECKMYQLLIYAAAQRNYLYKFLVDELHFAKSYSEARRKIKEGAVELNGIKYTNPHTYVTVVNGCIIPLVLERHWELEKAIDEDLERYND